MKNCNVCFADTQSDVSKTNFRTIFSPQKIFPFTLNFHYLTVNKRLSKCHGCGQWPTPQPHRIE